MKAKTDYTGGIGIKRILSLFSLVYFLLALSGPASAAVTTEISGFFYTDDTFVLNDKIAIVNVDSYDEVIIDYDNTFIVIRNSTCRRMINNDFCVDSIEFDNSVKKKKAQIMVFYVGPDITITRNINKSNPSVGEGVKITVKIENTGNSTADNLTYTDMFPQKIEVLKVKGSTAKIEKVLVWRNDTGSWQNMTRIFWQGDLRAGEILDFFYTLKPVDYIDSSFTAKVIFFNGIENVEMIAPSVSIKTETFFEIESKFAPTDFTVDAGSTTVITGESETGIEVGEEVLFITEIKNKALKNETINISYIDFYISDGLMYKGPASFRVYTNKSNANDSYTPGVHQLKKIGDNVYRWNGLMNADGLIFAMKLKGIKKVTARVSVYSHLVQFAEKKKPYYEPLYGLDYFDYEEMDIDIDEIVIESNFKDGQTFEAGEKAYFTLYVQNPNENANFTRIRAVLDTPWEPRRNITLYNLKKTNYLNLFDGFVAMPYMEKSATKKISANVTYETEYGEIYSARFDRSISIRPHVPVKISHSFSPSRGHTPERAFIVKK